MKKIKVTTVVSREIETFCKEHGLSINQFYGTEKVGGGLDLGSLTSIPTGFNPTVGAYLDLRSGLTANTTKPKGAIQTSKNKLLFWQDGKYVSADNILTEVVNKRGNVYRVRKIHSEKEFYLVTDGRTHAHGETLKEAKEDFRLKLIAEKIKSQPIKPDTLITINYYRTVTGACKLGVAAWMQQHGIKKQSYKAAELLPLLEKTNAYGLDRFKALLTFK